MSQAPQIRSLGELRDSGWNSRSVRDELRENLVERLRRNLPLFPGLFGYEETVVRQLSQAILARHDILLLGLRGQGKTRLLRSLPDLLDEWMPALAGTDLREDPFRPSTSTARRILSELGDAAPIAWIHRAQRYHEKLATPDTSMSDLIGDIDPVKAVALGLGFGHEDSVQWGLIPRSHRGIFAINELPDLQPRIQVGLLNLLEERDVQLRGFPVRIEVDALFAFSANPEDYTQRGNLITPLKDRIGSQILTHYPADTSISRRITDQESWTDRGTCRIHVPEPLREAVERIAFEARALTDVVDPRSGVSQRLSIAAMEHLVSAVELRAISLGQSSGEARLADLFSVVPALTGKLELVVEGEREGPQRVALALVGKACKAVFDATFRDPYDRRRKDPAENPDHPVVSWFEAGNRLDLSDRVTDDSRRRALEAVPTLEQVMRSVARDPGWEPGDDRCAWQEIFLEGLHQHGRIARDLHEGSLQFGDVMSGILR